MKIQKTLFTLLASWMTVSQSLFALHINKQNFKDTDKPLMINVMPYPSKVNLGTKKLRITKEFSINLIAQPNDIVLENATNRLLRSLNKKTLAYFEQEYVTNNNIQEKSVLTIKVSNKINNFSIGEDESYSITNNGVEIELSATNTLGALRGIETIYQLVGADETGFYFPEVQIEDTPRFKWRGMMVDVARHFIPIDILKRNIDAMAMVKLNVLHLHLSDDEGFRVESKVFPKLHEMGANGQYYTQDELKGLINYASEKGIIVYPEFDLPGHSTSWFAGYPDLASENKLYKAGHRFKIKEGTPIRDAVGIIMNSPTPTLDPTKESTFKFLEKFVAEMSTIFKSPYFHIGADENNGMAWLNNPQIVEFMKAHDMQKPHDLQAYFVKRMHSILKKNNKVTVGWEELFDSTLSQDIIVQVWGAIGEKRPTPVQIASQGNSILISKGFYLDYFLPAHQHYLNPNLSIETNAYILGGEAALWSELVDENSFEGRAWPRTAAIAERLWSPSTTVDLKDMYRRLFVLSDQLQNNGLNHHANTMKLFSELCNGQDLHNPMRVLETLAPSRGYGRLMSSFVAPERRKYQRAPLADLPDLVSCDSKEAWKFRFDVDSYLKTHDEVIKVTIKQQLIEWKKAAENIPPLQLRAPNLREFNIYAQRVIVAIDIALKALESPLTESEQNLAIKQIKELKIMGDRLEIQILPDVESLVTGKALPWTK